MAGEVTGRPGGGNSIVRPKTRAPPKQSPSIGTGTQQRAKFRAEEQLPSSEHARKEENQSVSPQDTEKGSARGRVARTGLA